MNFLSIGVFIISFASVSLMGMEADANKLPRRETKKERREKVKIRDKWIRSFEDSGWQVRNSGSKFDDNKFHLNLNNLMRRKSGDFGDTRNPHSARKYKTKPSPVMHKTNSEEYLSPSSTEEGPIPVERALSESCLQRRMERYQVAMDPRPSPPSNEFSLEANKGVIYKEIETLDYHALKAYLRLPSANFNEVIRYFNYVISNDMKDNFKAIEKNKLNFLHFDKKKDDEELEKLSATAKKYCKLQEKYLDFLESTVLPIIENAPLEVKKFYRGLFDTVNRNLIGELTAEQSQQIANLITNRFILSNLIPLIRPIPSPKKIRELREDEVQKAEMAEINFLIKDKQPLSDPIIEGSEDEKILIAGALTRLKNSDTPKHHLDIKNQRLNMLSRLLMKSFCIGELGTLVDFLRAFHQTFTLKESILYQRHQQIIAQFSQKFLDLELGEFPKPVDQEQ